MAKFKFDAPQNTKLDVLPPPAQEVLAKLPEPKITQVSDWRPTKLQREYKTRFLRKLEESGIEAKPENLTDEAIQKILPNHLLPGWRKERGFDQWFLNVTEFEDRLESLFSLSLDAIEDILLDTDPKSSSARIAAVKIVAELTNRTNKKEGNVQYIDKNVMTMDKEQLAEFIKKKTGIEKV